MQDPKDGPGNQMQDKQDPKDGPAQGKQEDLKRSGHAGS